MGSAKHSKGGFRWPWRRKKGVAAPSAAFDPVFYLRRYADLAEAMSTASEAEAHYRRHGQQEGRFGSAAEEEAADYRRYLTPSSEFDLAAYRSLNPDLAAAFVEDKEYILHFIRHGRAEKRKATFPLCDDDRAMAPWEQLFSVSQFSAWASEWIDHPETRAQALALFRAEGIERLAPIRFELRFDPSFYRRHYLIVGDQSDTALYQEWLECGLPGGRSPNEATLLRPYLGNLAFPDRFDWQGYARDRRIALADDRAHALIHLFAKEDAWASTRTYLPDLAPAYVCALARYRLRRDRARDAATLLDAWRDELNPDFNTLTTQGDVAAAVGRPDEALAAWRRALTLNDATWSLTEKITRAELRAGNFESAAAILTGSRDRWIGHPAFNEIVSDCLDQWFGTLATRSRDKLTNGETAADVTVLTEKELARLAQVMEALTPPPAALGPRADGPVLFLGNENLRQCTHYRIEQKQEQFARAGIALQRYSLDGVDQFIADLPGARGAIFYRVPSTPAVIRAILTARAMGIPTWYEIDDLLFCPSAYPPPFSSYGGAISIEEYRGLQLGVPLFRFALSLCDRAIASTRALLDEMLPVVRDHAGIVIRNGLDSRNVGLRAEGGAAQRNEPSRLRIFYGSGTLAHNQDYEEILAPALAQIMSERSDVELVLVGHVPAHPSLVPYNDRVLRFPVISDIREYWSILAACDLSVAILGEGLFEDCKSEIKWLEAAACGVPSIVSATAAFRDVVEDGKDGLIAATGEEWYRHLSHLLDDAQYRASLGTSARQKALQRYTLSHAAGQIESAFSPATVLDSDRKIAASADWARPLRVLLCNVFFHPQSIGGATRVVEGNVADIAAHCPDVDLAVFCSDEGFENPPTFRTSAYQTVPVFRVGLPTVDDMDHRAFDEASLPGFRRSLAIFKPDLVHFHCIQRLSASIVDECLRQRIPYIVTLHDGWWFSRNQFLVDEEGLLQRPGSDLLVAKTRSRRDVEDLRRRRLLAHCLSGAACVTTVSESFASLCRDAGLSVRVIENGLPSLTASSTGARTSGLLRMAHIGGRSSHKGADLVEAAFRLGRYGNLSLLMIDGTLGVGEVIETRWGESDVRISAPFSQAHVEELYDAMDVLLAPSRWPESYGLVAREATSQGIWTVASRLGAMGEDLIKGKNGFLIDTQDRSNLDTVLTMMNADPDRFRRGTAMPVMNLRPARAQATEFAALYREVAERPKA